MMSGTQCRRLIAMAVLMAIAFISLGYRLVDLQLVQHERFRKESEGPTRRMFLRAPKRGDIRDIRGNLLAGSIFVKTICADPPLLGEHRAEFAHVIAPLLELNETELFHRLQPRLCTNASGQPTPDHYVVLKNKVPVETWERIQEALKQLPLDVNHDSMKRAEKKLYAQLRQGIFAEDVEDQVRVYPNHRLAAHVLGCVGAGFAPAPKGKVAQLQGLEGIEQSMNKALTGVVGWRKTEMARRWELVAFRDQDVEAHAGRNVVLTIDAGVQHILESELAEAMEKHTPISACGLVVRPRTGEILAMATLPNFDPNDLKASTADARRDRIITDQAEPGSTFKIVVISGALNDGLITLDDKFDCENGDFFFAGQHLHDHEHFGVLSVEEIVTHSSNIGAAKVGLRMGPDRLYEYVREFGFGQQTGVPLFGEVRGRARSPKEWTKVSISRIPMGQEVAVTTLQMVMAMCAIGNNGRLMRPMLVDRLEDENGQVVFKNYPQEVRQVVSERASKLMIAALKTVVATNGTGRKAALEHYTVAGKTGTAQKVVNGTYRHDKHFSSFIGMFPADEPELCVAVFLDEPKNGYYGGESAGPVFHDIAERLGQYLAIKADIMPLPPATLRGPATAAPLAMIKKP